MNTCTTSGPRQPGGQESRPWTSAVARFARGVAVLAAVASAVLPADAAETAARPPASSLTRPDEADLAPDVDGFILRWLVLEPIRVNTRLADGAVRAAVWHEYFPDQFNVMPRHGDQVTIDGAQYAWHALDTRQYNLNLYHFAYALGKPTSFVLFWVVTVVHCPREMAGVRLAIGSNAASVWWVNGQETIALYGDRQTVIDDGVSRRLTLQPGPNVVRGAVINGGGATDFCARFLDAEERPVKAFTVRLEVPGRETSTRGR